MSFTCGPCHFKATGVYAEDAHWIYSYGPCEDCKVARECVDCKCQSVPRPERHGGVSWDQIHEAVRNHAPNHKHTIWCFEDEITDEIWVLLGGKATK
jgi:hypothetical protein